MVRHNVREPTDAQADAGGRHLRLGPPRERAGARRARADGGQAGEGERVLMPYYKPFGKS